jgi:hypothetical protein
MTIWFQWVVILCSSAIVHNALLLVGVVACDDGQRGFCGIEVDGLMRQIRSDEDEIALVADDRLL